MHKVKVVLASALIALAFAGSTPQEAQASLSGPCDTTVGSGSAPIRLKLWEDENWDDLGNEKGVICFRASGSLNVPNLKNVAYNLGNRICYAQPPSGNGTWNDCISSEQWDLDCHQRIQYYGDANYGTLFSNKIRYDSGSDPSWPFILPSQADVLSSLKIIWTSSGGCQAPAP